MANPTPSRFARRLSYSVIVLIHIGTAYALWRGPTWKLVALALAFYAARMIAVTASYHRYFSHRTFKTSRAFQFVLAVLGTTAMQKGPLWWAGVHRLHHRYSDTPKDVHSPAQRGFFYAHMGWWLGHEHEQIPWDQIRDLAKYPELRLVDRFHVVGPILCAAAAYAIAGWQGVLWGYGVSTFLLMHAVYSINSLAHVFGSRRYATTDTSRNNVWLAILTMGEGWHNNHHHYQSSANQGFFWWEIDVTYYLLLALAKIGLIWDVRRPPAHVIGEGRAAPVPAKPGLRRLFQGTAVEPSRPRLEARGS
jgi:stearoyl-CoA desaturase (delta-9 desaturase)